MAKEIKTKLKKTRWLADQIALGILTMNSWKSLWLGGREKKHWLCLLVSDFTQLIKKSSLFFFIRRSTKLASYFFKKKIPVLVWRQQGRHRKQETRWRCKKMKLGPVESNVAESDGIKSTMVRVAGGKINSLWQYFWHECKVKWKESSETRLCPLRVKRSNKFFFFFIAIELNSKQILDKFIRFVNGKNEDCNWNRMK